MAELDYQSRDRIEKYISLLGIAKYGGLICYLAILAAVLYLNPSTEVIVLGIFLGLLLAFSPFFFFSSRYRGWYQSDVLGRIYGGNLESADDSQLNLLTTINAVHLFEVIDEVHTDISFHTRIRGIDMSCWNTKGFHYLRRMVNGKHVKQNPLNRIFDGVIIATSISGQPESDMTIVSAELVEKQFPKFGLLLNKKIKTEGVKFDKSGKTFYYYSESNPAIEYARIRKIADFNKILLLEHPFSISQKDQELLIVFPSAEYFMPPEELATVNQVLSTDRKLLHTIADSLK